jgi:hypothetical protein
MKEENKSVYTVQHGLYVCVKQESDFLSSSHSSCSLLLYPSFIRRIHIAHPAIEKENSQVGGRLNR